MNDDTILSLDLIKAGLRDKRLYSVAGSTGLSYPTVKKLAGGGEFNYTRDTLKVISKYVKECNVK